MICVSVKANTTSDTLHKILKAKRAGADMVEIRLDYIKDIKDFNLETLLSKKTLPAIITARPTWDGGNFSGSENKRIALLRQAIELGAEYIDLEFKAYKDIIRKQTKLILSYHQMSFAPIGNIFSILKKMEAREPDIIKIAFLTNHIKDVIEIAKLQLRSKKPSIIFAIGEVGLVTRILYKKLGSFLVYTALKKGEETAPYQPAVEEMLKLYRVREIDNATKVFALLGNPVSYSKSPLIFNNIFARRKINAVYIPIAVDNISYLKELVNTFDIKGMSITMPHKTNVIKFIDKIEGAKRIGAVNTIKVLGEKLVGYNTDCEGAMMSIINCPQIKFKKKLKKKNVLVIGGGGTARAIVSGLTKIGSKVSIANRTYPKAKIIADKFNCKIINFADLQKGNTKINESIIINATSVGMYPQNNLSPINKKNIRKNMLVFDCVYAPRETKLLKDARKVGAKTISGMEMFKNQLKLQYKLFFGTALNLTSFEKTL